MPRPKKEINKEEFEKLCEFHCTVEEVITWFRISKNVLGRWVKEHYPEYEGSPKALIESLYGAGKVSLKRAMFQKALEGNVSLMIWLSKQYLGMSEKVESNHVAQGEVIFRTEWGTGFDSIESADKDSKAVL